MEAYEKETPKASLRYAILVEQRMKRYKEEK